MLLNRIGTFAVGDSLGPWLRRVARQVSRQARRARARSARREAVAARGEGMAAVDPGREEALAVIREEVDRLPERYRAPIVLCDLLGLTREEAAERLGCPSGTVGGRIFRGRRRLRGRLERRGIAPALPLPAPGEAWRSSLREAIRTAGAIGAGASASASVLALAEGSSRACPPLPGRRR